MNKIDNEGANPAATIEDIHHILSADVCDITNFHRGETTEELLELNR